MGLNSKSRPYRNCALSFIRQDLRIFERINSRLHNQLRDREPCEQRIVLIRRFTEKKDLKWK